MEDYFELPDCIRIKNKSRIQIMVSDWEDAKGAWRDVTVKDVIKYFRYEAPSFNSCRTLSNITGDWRMIDSIAEDCLAVFKGINNDKLRRIRRQYGIEPKF